MRYYLTFTRMDIIKKTNNNRCWQECGEIGTLIYFWQDVKLFGCFGKEFCNSLKNKRVYDPIIPLLCISPKERKIYVHTKIYIQMSIATLFIVAKKWEQPHSPSTDE